MKHLLRQMLEWHTHAISPGNHDTWFNGRFVEQWAEPRALEQMREAFAHYAAADVVRALSIDRGAAYGTTSPPPAAPATR